LSEKGRAEAYSHEANGHAYVYIITNGDRKKAKHSSSMINNNPYLYNIINRSKNETIDNMEEEEDENAWFKIMRLYNQWRVLQK